MNELLSILKGHTSIEEALEFYQLIYRAVKENAYIHPGWDYLRYPSVTIKYIDKHIKPKFEEFGFPLDDNYFYVRKYKDYLYQ